MSWGDEVKALEATYRLAAESSSTSLAEWSKGAQEMVWSLAAAIDSEVLGVQVGFAAARLREMVERSRALASVGMYREAAMVLALSPEEAAGRWPSPQPPLWLYTVQEGDSGLKQSPLREAVTRFYVESVRLPGFDSREAYIAILKAAAPMMLAIASPGAAALVDAVESGKTLSEAAGELPDNPVARALVVRGRWLLVGAGLAVALWLYSQYGGRR